MNFSPNLDFLADPAAVILNLVPDKDGVVRVSRKALGNHAWIHVVAVDPEHLVVRESSLPEQPAKFLDLRLAAGLDPQGHFTQQKQVSILGPQQPLVLNDAASSRFEAYDSLGKVYTLYTTLTKDAKLAEFSFILNWPKLPIEEKRKLYSKYACHELHFFLLKKDVEFFRSVVKPYLANKKDKTFLDEWFLESQLGSYAEPWTHARLNSVERILLAQRISGEPTRTTRHLQDLLRLQPPQPDNLRRLFETAVQSSDLEVEKAGIPMDPAKKELPTMRAPATPPAPSPESDKAKDGKAGEKRDEARPTGKPSSANEPEQGEAKNGRQKLREGKSAGLKGYGNESEFDAEEAKRGFGFHLEQPRGNAQQLYRRIDPTMEWAENNYYHLPIQQQIAALVPVNDFWLDYANHDGKSPFLSKHLAQPSRNFTDMMLALAVLELPFEAGKPDVKFEGNKLTFTPTAPAIVFHEEIRPVAMAADKLQILISQNFYRHGDRFRDQDGERLDKFVSEEFLTQVQYGCQVVVTNATSSKQRLTVLLQVPVGAVPLHNGQFTRSVAMELEPYRTQTVDYLFYFPFPGRFAHFPIHVAKNETLVAAVSPVTLNVVATPSKVDTESWDYVSQYGTPEQVVSLLNRENLLALNLDKIAFRMKDRAFFTTVVKLLQERHGYSPTLWSYGLFHNDQATAREFLRHNDDLVAEAGGSLNSPLLIIDPVARHQYEHLEYKPLANARAHALGKQRQIVNQRFLQQYQRFLRELGYQRQLDDEDNLALTYYLTLQDRTEEALAAFHEVRADNVASKLQYDYAASYLDFFGDDFRTARALAAKHANHPVDRWRNAFASVRQLLDEIDGNGLKITDDDDRTQRQTQLASKEPSFEFTLDGKTMMLNWQNLESVQVNYYLMDVELLFSRNPFVQQSGNQFASIRPNQTQQWKLPATQGKQGQPIPADLAGRNVLVEITAGGKTRSLPYYANSMNVRMMENYGQLVATESATGKPLPRTYVKTYVRLANGQVKFHKDGYTDQRGRFDYSSVSTPEPIQPQRFSILVLYEEKGAQIVEATPPQR